MSKEILIRNLYASTSNTRILIRQRQQNENSRKHNVMYIIVRVKPQITRQSAKYLFRTAPDPRHAVTDAPKGRAELDTSYKR